MGATASCFQGRWRGGGSGPGAVGTLGSGPTGITHREKEQENGYGRESISIQPTERTETRFTMVGIRIRLLAPEYQPALHQAGTNLSIMRGLWRTQTV